MSSISKFYSEEDYNKILDKINKNGLGSLTEKEKNILDNISKSDEPLEKHIDDFKGKLDEFKKTAEEFMKVAQKLNQSKSLKEVEKFQKEQEVVEKKQMEINMMAKYIKDNYGIDAKDVVPKQEIEGGMMGGDLSDDTPDLF